MTPEVRQYLGMYQATQDYLKLAPSYCEHLGGLRWSNDEDALVLSDGRHVAFNDAVAEFLEGFQSGGRLVPFCYVLHGIDLLQNLRELDAAQVVRLRSLFHEADSNWRNAGALAAVLARDVPEAVRPPEVELICRRLRDRAFPIRWYAARYHGAAVEPPLAPAEFETRVQQVLERYSDDELRAWLRSGRGPVKEAGEALTRELPPPRTLAGVLASLLQRPRLAGAETYVAQFVSALALPPRRMTPQELPVGGYADMVTHGQIEHLLPSQHALDDLEFLRRFAERELLYFRREEPPIQHRQELAVLLDQGVRTWGDVRLVLAAAALALAQQAQRRDVPFALAGTSNGGRLVAPLETEDETLGQLIEASDLTLNPGLALEGLLERPSEVLRDVVLLTHPRNLREADVLHAARRAGPRDRLFALTLDAHGAAELCEVRHGAPVRLRQFRVAFEQSRPRPAPPSNPAAAVPGAAWSGQCEAVPFPFRFGTDGPAQLFDFDEDGEHLLTVSSHGLLHLWRLDGSGHECLPRPRTGEGTVLWQFTGVVGVVGGFALCGWQNGTFFVAHYDVTRRTVVSRTYHHLTHEPPVAHLQYVRSLHALVMASADRASGFALDLTTGCVCTNREGGDHSRAGAAWYLFASGQLLDRGRIVRVETAASADMIIPKSQPAGCGFDWRTGQVSLRGQEDRWHTFLPAADGKPLLKGGSIQRAQIAGQVLTLTISGPHGKAVLLCRRDDGAIMREYPIVRSNHRVVDSLLAPDGRWLALARSDHRIEVDAVMRPPGGITTRLGGFSVEGRLYVGRGFFLLNVGTGYQFWHLIDWRSGTLECLFERCRGAGPGRTSGIAHPALRAALQENLIEASAADLRDVSRADSARFHGGARLDARDYVIDRYGQVAVFDEGRRLIAMFMAFRDRVAAWLPDGTRHGSPSLSQGSIDSAGREKIARALRGSPRKGDVA